MGLNSWIDPGVNVIDAGMFTVGWEGFGCHGQGCTDQYVVKIERLGKPR